MSNSENLYHNFAKLVPSSLYTSRMKSKIRWRRPVRASKVAIDLVLSNLSPEDVEELLNAIEYRLENQLADRPTSLHAIKRKIYEQVAMEARSDRNPHGDNP